MLKCLYMRLRPVTLGYGLRLHLFTLQINVVTLVTLVWSIFRARELFPHRVPASASRAHTRAREKTVTTVTSLIFKENKRNRRP